MARNQGDEGDEPDRRPDPANPAGHPTTPSQRRRLRRNELIAWVIVVALSVTAFLLLVTVADVLPLYAFLGVLLALDLPVCLDLIWRAGRENRA